MVGAGGGVAVEYTAVAFFGPLGGGSFVQPVGEGNRPTCCDLTSCRICTVRLEL